MDNNFTNIKERILYIIDFHNDTKQYFFDKIGMTYGNFKGKNKNTPLNSDAIANILSIYRDIDPEWLITGNGAMLKSTNDGFLNEPHVKYDRVCNKCVKKDERIKELDYTISVQRDLIEEIKKHREMGAENASVADVG